MTDPRGRLPARLLPLAPLALVLLASRAEAQDAPPGSPAPAPAPQLDPYPADPPAAAPATPPTGGAAPGPAAAGREPIPAAGADAPPVPRPPREPAEVTVAGTRLSRTAGSAHIIGEARLERFKYDDPHAVLASVPGVYSRGEDGFGLRPNIGIRGTNPDRSKKIALMEDGVLFGPAPYSAAAAYFFPNMARMVSVRVIKGPGAIVYGPQSIGGAIDLVTRQVPNGTSGSADLAVGQFAYRKVHAWAGTGNEKSGVLLEALHLGNDGFKNLPSGADTGFVHNEWMVKAFYVLDPTARERHEFRIKATYSDEISNETYLGLADQELREHPDRRYGASALDRMKWFHTSVVATHVFEPTHDFSVTTNVYRHDFSRTWRKVNGFRGTSIFDVLRDPTLPRNAIFTSILRGESDSASSAENILIGPNQRDFVSQGVETRVRWSPTTGPVSHKIEYGLRVHEDRIERRHSEDAFRVVGGQLFPEGSPTVVTAYNEASTLATAMHVVDAATWKGLTVTPGARVEVMQQTFKDLATSQSNRQLTQVFLPGVGVYQSITRDLGVLGGVYQGFSPPVPGLGPLKTEPELSVNYEAGARFTRGRARLEAIGFYNDYSNLTDVCTLSSGCVDTNLDRQFDAGRARIYGLEAFAEHQVPLGKRLRAPLLASYTFTQSEFLTTFSSEDPIYGNVRRGYELPYVPQHQASFSAGLEHRRAGGNVAMNYVAKMREEAGDEPIDEALHTDAQVTFDLSAYVRLLDNVVLYMNVRNLFDERYIVSRRPYGARPNAPRWAQVGLKVTF